MQFLSWKDMSATWLEYNQRLTDYYQLGNGSIRKCLFLIPATNGSVLHPSNKSANGLEADIVSENFRLGEYNGPFMTQSG